MTLLGFVAGAVLGLVFSLLGAGGAILAVPVLLFGFGLPLAQATAGGLAVVWAAAVTGAVGHARGGRVRWRAVALFGGPSMLGAVAGAWLHARVPERVTLGLFAAVVLLAVALVVRAPREAAGMPELRAAVLAPVGLAVGVLTGFLGVGGGFLIVPALLVLARLPLKEAIGTSMAVIAGASFTGAATYLVAGQAPLAVVLPVGAGAVLGAAAGVPLGARLPERALRLGFAVLASAVALAMAWRAAAS